MPDSPWPADMRIEISDGSSSVNLLLFARSALRLDDHGLPPLEGTPDPGSSTRPTTHTGVQLNELWARDWRRTAGRIVSPADRTIRAPDAEMQMLLDTSTDTELWEALEPSALWRQAIDNGAYRRWAATLGHGRTLPLEHSPDGPALAALVAAWRSGLASITELPYEGYFADRTDDSHLVVSSATRRDTALFIAALATPAPG